MSFIENPGRGRLILHIGLHKTGTTTIQHFLYENKELLKERGVLYPFDEVSHWKLAAAALLTRNDPEGTFSIQWDELSLLSRENPNQHILLSSEDFSLAIIQKNQEVITSFFEMLRSLGRSIDLIVFLRRQDEWLESLYLEHLKHVSRIELNEFILMQKKLLNYKGVLLFWQKNLGNNCTIKPVIYGKNLSDDICSDFLRLIGIENTGDFKSVGHFNERHTLLRTQIHYGINGKLWDYVVPGYMSWIFFPVSKLRPIIQKYLQRIDEFESTRHFRCLPFNIAKNIMASADKGNSFVAEKWFPDQQGNLFLEPLRPYKEVSLGWPDDMPDNLKLILLKLWESILLSLDAPFIPLLDDQEELGINASNNIDDLTFYSVRLDPLPAYSSIHDISPDFGTLVSINGNPISQEMTLGEGMLKIEGWAVLPSGLMPAKAAIALVNGVPYMGKTGMPVSELAGPFSNPEAGFMFVLPSKVFDQPVNSLRFIFCGDIKEIFYSTGQQYNLYKDADTLGQSLDSASRAMVPVWRPNLSGPVSSLASQTLNNNVSSPGTKDREAWLSGLKKFKNIIISGPHHSGTDFLAFALGRTLNVKRYEEETLKNDNLDLLQSLLESDHPKVIHCPALCHCLDLIQREDTLIILMKREIVSILQAESRHSADESRRRDDNMMTESEYEKLKYISRITAEKDESGLPPIDYFSSPISIIKYDFWERRQQKRIPHTQEVDYNSLVHLFPDLWSETAENEFLIAREPVIKNDGLYAKLYIDEGFGFNEILALETSISTGNNLIVFELSEFKHIKALRFDPMATPGCAIIRSILLRRRNPPSIRNVEYFSNADYLEENKLYFAGNDPNIFILENDLTDLDAIEIDFKVIEVGFEYLNKINKTESLLALLADRDAANKSLSQMKMNLEAELIKSNELLALQSDRMENFIKSWRIADMEKKALLVSLSTFPEQLKILYDEKCKLEIKLASISSDIRALEATVQDLNKVKHSQELQIQSLAEELTNSQHVNNQLREAKEAKDVDLNRLREIIKELETELLALRHKPAEETFPVHQRSLWTGLLQLAVQEPKGFIRQLNARNLSILLSAVRNEPAGQILRNARNRLLGSINTLTIGQPTAESGLPSVSGKEAPGLQQDRKLQYFIDQVIELEYHISIRGWLFSETHEVSQITLSQGNEDPNPAALVYKLERWDVYNHFDNRYAVSSGFSDQVEKIRSGEVDLFLDVLFEDGHKARLGIGKLTLSESRLSHWHPVILENKSDFVNGLSSSNHLDFAVGVYSNSKGNYFFHEIKQLVVAGLSNIGYRVLDMDETVGFSKEAALHIVVAPHEFFAIGNGQKLARKTPKGLILLNTEQPSSQWFKESTAFFRQAIEVWDMNYYSWKKMHASLPSAKYLPLAYLKDFMLFDEVPRLPENYCTRFLDKEILNRSYLHSPFKERPIDILFVGHASPRRQQFFARHAGFFARYNCYFHLTDLSLGPVLENPTSLNTKTAIGLAQRSKIVLNIHHGSQTYFEWHRMVIHGIWQKCLVISDLCSEAPPFTPGRDFIQGDLDALPEIISYYLSNSKGSKEADGIIRHAYEQLTKNCELTSILREIMAPWKK